MFLLFVLLFGARAWSQEPVTLEQAVAIAVENNPALRAAEEEGAAARARTGQAQAAWYPRIDFVQGFTRGNNPVYVFGTLLTQRQFTAANFALAGLNAPPPLDNFQTRFEGQWMLFDGNRTRHRVATARRLESAADFEAEQARQDLILRVVRSYYGVLVAQENLAAAREAVRFAQASEQRVATLEKAGLVVTSDLLSAQVFLAQMKEREIRAENSLELAGLTLSHELGLDPGAAKKPAGVLDVPPAELPSLEELESAALAARPALRAAELQKQAAEIGGRHAKSEFAPRLGLFANLERDAEALGGPSGTNWTAGARLEWNLFAGGADRYRLAEAKARERQAASLLESFRSSVRLEVRQAYSEVKAAALRAEAARAAVGQARESLRIIQNRYEAGLSTMTDLLRAQSAQLDARTAYLAALHDWQAARAQLERAAGRLTADSSLISGR